MSVPTKSGFKEVHQPCPCGQSSDAYCIRADGTGWCFSCANEKNPDKNKGAKMTGKFSFQVLPYRGVDADVMKFYAALTAVGKEDSKPHHVAFNHPNGRVMNRSLASKDFWWSGEKQDDKFALFGQNLFAPGSAKAITVTEGYLDAMSSYQMQGKKYPVVAVTSASSAKKECAEAHDYLNSFDKIYLALDSDEPGKEAAAAIARMFDFNKVFMVHLQKKDSNDYLTSGETEAYVRDWWAAKRFLPEGVLSTYSDFDKVIDEDGTKPFIPYPFARLQQMTYGIRTGELVLLTAQEGMGKTEIFRALEYHILKTTNDNVGIIHLEESKARTLKGLVGYELKAPIHLPDFSIPKDEIKAGIRTVTKRDDRLHAYSHFGSEDPDVILSTVRFLAGACGCKYIFLDHITMVVTGLGGEDERRALDYISTRLAMMVEELDFTLFLISHVNDEGKTRGSRNISKVADLRIDMYRNLTAEGEMERNTTYLTVSKNRYAGRTGPAGALIFNPETYVLSEQEEMPE